MFDPVLGDALVPIDVITVVLVAVGGREVIALIVVGEVVTVVISIVLVVRVNVVVESGVVGLGLNWNSVFALKVVEEGFSKAVVVAMGAEDLGLWVVVVEVGIAVILVAILLIVVVEDGVGFEVVGVFTVVIGRDSSQDVVGDVVLAAELVKRICSREVEGVAVIFAVLAVSVRVTVEEATKKGDSVVEGDAYDTPGKVPSSSSLCLPRGLSTCLPKALCVFV